MCCCRTSFSFHISFLFGLFFLVFVFFPKISQGTKTGEARNDSKQAHYLLSPDNPTPPPSTPFSHSHPPLSPVTNSETETNKNTRISGQTSCFTDEDCSTPLMTALPFKGLIT